MRWLSGDLREAGQAEVEFGPPTVYIDRMTAESNDFFDVRDEDGRIIRLIHRREDENIPHGIRDLEEPDEGFDEENEDAMSHVDGEALPVCPKPKNDLVFWTELRKLPDGARVKVEVSAPVFPKLRDKRLRGYANILEKLVKQGKLKRRGLFMTLRTALRDGKVSKAAARRLWEIEQIERYLSAK